MIIIYYLQKKDNPNIKTVALACAEDPNRVNPSRRGVYFYLDNKQFKLVEMADSKGLKDAYIILKEFSIPHGGINDLVIGLPSLYIMEQCQKYIEEMNLAEYRHVFHELQRSSITYPLGRVLFKAAFKNGIPGPLTLLSAETLSEFIQATEKLLKTILEMQAKLDDQSNTLTTQLMYEPKFCK